MANEEVFRGSGKIIIDAETSKAEAKISNSMTRISESLKKIKGLNLNDVKLKVDTAEAQKALDYIKLHANDLENALTKAFNVNMNTFNVSRFNKELSKTDTTLKDFGNNLVKLGPQGELAFLQVARAATQTYQIAHKTTTIFDKLGKTLANTIRWQVSTKIINSFTGAIQSAWGYAQRLDESLNNIRIVTGKSADEMDKFADKANKAAKALRSSTTSYTDAALIYYQQGLGETDVQARTRTTIKAANVTGQSAAEVSQQLTAVWNGYKVVAEEAELYVDKLAAVAAETAADLEELSDGMSKVASAANAMGVDVDQLSAQLSTIISVTRQDAAVVGTALKTIYSRMGDLKVDGVDEFGTSLGDVSGQLQTMGIQVLDQQGNLRDMGTVIEEVAAKWQTWTDAQQQAAAVAIAGKRQYNNLIALFENWDMYESALSTSKGAEGTLEKQQKTYEESMEAILQKWETAKESFKGNLFDVDSMETVVGALTKIADALGFVTKSMGGLKNMLPLFTGLLLKNSKVNGMVSQGLYSIGKGIGDTGRAIAATFTGGKFSPMAKNLKEIEGTLEQFGPKAVNATKQLLAVQDLYDKGFIDKETYETAKIAADNSYNTQVAAKREEVKRDQQGTTDVFNAIAAERKTQEIVKDDKGNVIEDVKGEVDADYNEAYLNYLKKLNKESEEFEKNLDDIKTKIKEVSMSEADATNLDNLEVELQQLEKQADELENAMQALKSAEENVRKLPKGTKEWEQADQQRQNAEKEVNTINTNLWKAYEDTNISNIITTKKNEIEEQKSLESKTGVRGGAAKSTVQVNKSTEALQKNLKEAKNKLNLDQNQVKVLDSLISRLDEVKKAMGTNTQTTEVSTEQWEEYQKIVKDADDILEAFLETKKETTQQQKDEARKVAEGTDIVTEANESYEQQQAKLRKTLEASKMTTQEIISGYTQLAGQLMTLYSGFNMVTDAIEGLKEGTMSASESITGMVSGVITIVQSIGAAVQMQQQAMLMSTIAASQGMQTAGYAAQTAFGWISVVMNLIVAAVSLISGIVKIIGKQKSEAEKAQEALNKAKENADAVRQSLKDTQTAYKDLKTEIEDYGKARLALDEMRTGTQEWRDAVYELNMQVLELMSKYPQLVSAITMEDGIYTIDDTAFDKLIEQKRQEIAKQQLSVAVADYAITQAERKALDINYTTTLASSVRDFMQLDGWAGSRYLENYSYNKHLDSDIAAGNAGEKNTNFTKALMSDLDFLITDAFSTGAADVFRFSKTSATEENLEKLNKYIAEGSFNSDEMKLLTEIRETMKSQIETTAVNSDKLTKNSEYLYQMIASDNGIVDADTFATLGMSKDDFLQTDKGRDIVANTRKALWNQYMDAYAGKSETNDSEKMRKEVENLYKQAFGKDAQIVLDDVDWGDIESEKGLSKISASVNGKSVKFDEVILALSAGKIESEIKNYTEPLQTAMKDYEKKGYNSKAAYFLNDYYANGTVLKENPNKLSQSDINEILAQSEKTGITSSYVEDYQAYFANQKRSKLIGTGLSISDSRLDNFTLSEIDSFSSNINKAIASGAGDAIKGLLQAITTAEEMDAFAEAIANVNWADTSSVNTFLGKLTTASIDITKAGDAWNTFMQTMHSGMKQWIQDSDRVKQNFAFLQETFKELKTGDLISDDEYKKLLAIDPNQVKNFIKTASGDWKTLVSGTTIIRDQQKQFSNFSDINEYYQDLQTATKGLTGNKYLNSDQLTKEDLEEYFTADDGKVKIDVQTIAEKFGYDETYIQNLLTTLNEADPSSTQYLSAKQSLQNLASSVNQIVLDAESGKLDTAAAQEFFVTSVAKTWDEVIEVVTDPEIFQKAKKLWKNNFIEILGGYDFLSILSIEELSEMADIVRKKELNWLDAIDEKIEQLDKKIEKAFGIEKIALINESIAAQKEGTIFSKIEAQNASKVLNNSISELIDVWNANGNKNQDVYTILKEVELNPSDFINIDTGKFDSSLFSQWLNDQDTSEWSEEALKQIEGIISLINNATEAETAYTNSLYEMIDKRLEIINLEKQAVRDLLSVSKQIVSFSFDIKKWNQGLKAFVEENSIFTSERVAAEIIQQKLKTNISIDWLEDFQTEVQGINQVSTMDADINGVGDKTQFAAISSGITNTDKAKQQATEWQSALGYVEGLSVDLDAAAQERKERVKENVNQKINAYNTKEDELSAIDSESIQRYADSITIGEYVNMANAREEKGNGIGLLLNGIDAENLNEHIDINGLYATITKAFGGEHMKAKQWYNLGALTYSDEAIKEYFTSWTLEDVTKARTAAEKNKAGQAEINAWKALETNLISGVEEKKELRKEAVIEKYNNTVQYANDLNQQAWADYSQKIQQSDALQIAKDKIAAGTITQEDLDALTEAGIELSDEQKTAILEAVQEGVTTSTKASDILSEFDAQLKELNSGLTSLNEKAKEKADKYDYIEWDEEKGEYIVDKQSFAEDWKAAIDEAQSELESLQKLIAQLYDTWFQGQEEIMVLFDEQINKIKSVQDATKTLADLWKLVGKNISSDFSEFSNTLNGYYSNMTNYSAKNYELAQSKLQAAANEYQTMLNMEGIQTGADEEGNPIYGYNADMKKTITENYQTALAEAATSASEWAAAVGEQFQNALTNAIDSAFSDAYGGDTLAQISEQWDLATRVDDQRLDEVNSQYEADKLLRAWQKSINETDDPLAKNQLAQKRAEQEEKLNKILIERGKISQYELDRMNAEYDLTLKQIALEEAQKNAQTLKMTRDEFGNYSYQYVADQDAINQAQEELLAAQNNLYNLDKDRTKELVTEYYALHSEFQSAYGEAVAASDENRMADLKEYYFGANGLLTTIKEEMGIASDNFEEVSSVLSDGSWESYIDKFVNGVKNLDINSLLGNVQNAANVALDAYSMIGELFDQESPLQTAIDEFNENINNLDVQDLMYQAQEVSKNNANTIIEIINLTSQLTELEKFLAISMDEYYNFLKENSLDKTVDVTKDAADAVRTAKASIDTLNTTLNNLSVVWTPNTSTEDPDDGYWAFGPTPQQS